MSAHILSFFSDSVYRCDKIAGLIGSLMTHIILFVVGGLILIKPLEFAVEAGSSGIEINLVAAPVLQDIIRESTTKIQNDSDAVPIPVQEIKPNVKLIPQPQPVMKTPAKDHTTIQSKGGAIVEAKPDYLSNPAPRYPFQARQRGWQGTVFLTVTVDRQGHPIRLGIERSSGYDILDESALKAVRTWNFRPAKLGIVAVDSVVKIPVRFDLKDSH